MLVYFALFLASVSYRSQSFALTFISTPTSTLSSTPTLSYGHAVNTSANCRFCKMDSVHGKYVFRERSNSLAVLPWLTDFLKINLTRSRSTDQHWGQSDTAPPTTVYNSQDDVSLKPRHVSEIHINYTC